MPLRSVFCVFEIDTTSVYLTTFREKSLKNTSVAKLAAARPRINFFESGSDGGCDFSKSQSVIGTDVRGGPRRYGISESISPLSDC